MVIQVDFSGEDFPTKGEVDFNVVDAEAFGIFCVVVAVIAAVGSVNETGQGQVIGEGDISLCGGCAEYGCNCSCEGFVVFHLFELFVVCLVIQNFGKTIRIKRKRDFFAREFLIE